MLGKDELDLTRGEGNAEVHDTILSMTQADALGYRSSSNAAGQPLGMNSPACTEN